MKRASFDSRGVDSEKRAAFAAAAHGDMDSAGAAPRVQLTVPTCSTL